MAPLPLFIVATPVDALVHVPPASPSLLNVVEPFEHTASVPLRVPAFGAAVTVTVLVAVASTQVPAPVTV